MASPLTCAQLLANLPAPPLATGTLRFGGVGDCDVYNIAAPFWFDGRLLLAGRVESRATEYSTLMLFERAADGVWHPCPEAPTFEALQDPCVAFVDGELVLGGVRYPVTLPSGQIGWRMDFYRGRRLDGLEHFLSGPDHMKDIRLAQRRDGRVTVFSRPHGAAEWRARIGLTTVDRLADLTAERIAEAPLLTTNFVPYEWGGANEAHLLPDGRFGVLGHIAWMEAGDIRHYYPMVFAVDPDTLATTPVRIIATRAQFPPGPAKRPDLVDVVFSGGLQRHWDGTATLFAGVSDAGAAWLTMPDPLLGL
ncbi:MAG: DUF1861 family protein [Armatimonadetes bacterium]|nr:DUF1861 family protein [Armatimonadota bacterium]